MNEPIVRPRVAELVFRVYDRSLHPELVETLAIRRVRRNDETLTVRITPTGHLLEWSVHDRYLTEVTTTKDESEALPIAGRRLVHRVEGSRRGSFPLPGGGRYQFELSVEILPPEVFLQVHQELADDGARRGLLFHFRPHHRLGLTPIGFVTVDVIPTGLAVNAFHTFPEEFTVLKTQSLIEPRSN